MPKLSAEETPEKKKKILQEEYQIPMTVELEEEVEKMCNLSEAVERRGIEKGIEQGIEQLVMRSYRKGRTSEAIAEFMDISLEKVEEIIAGHTNQKKM